MASIMAKKMGRKKRIKDEELLAIARDVFIEKGIGAPTHEIARQAGISEGVIFQRYTTKEELFFAAMVPPPVNLDEIFGNRTQDHDACKNLEEIALAMLAYFRGMMPMALRLSTHPAFVPKKVFAHDSAIPEIGLLNGLREYFEEEKSRGRLKSDDTAAAAGILIATVHSLALFEIMGAHGGHMQDDVLRAMIRSFWNGLAPG